MTGSPLQERPWYLESFEKPSSWIFRGVTKQKQPERAKEQRWAYQLCRGLAGPPLVAEWLFLESCPLQMTSSMFLLSFGLFVSSTPYLNVGHRDRLLKFCSFHRVIFISTPWPPRLPLQNSASPYYHQFPVIQFGSHNQGTLIDQRSYFTDCASAKGP